MNSQVREDFRNHQSKQITENEQKSISEYQHEDGVTCTDCPLQVSSAEHCANREKNREHRTDFDNKTKPGDGSENVNLTNPESAHEFPKELLHEFSEELAHELSHDISHELTDREKDLAYMPIKKIFFKLYIPAVVAMVVQAIYTLVDRIFIARIPDIGDYAIGGVGIVMPLYFLCFGVFMLFGIGGSANISISLGKRDRTRAERIFGTSLSALFITMFLLMIFFLIFSRDILLWYGATQNNIEYAHDYFVILVVGALWASLSFAMNQVIRAEGNAKYSMLSILVGAVSNLILDPVFIFVFQWGVKGAAYATILSQFISFVFCALYFIRGKSSIRLHPNALIPRFELLKSIVGIGFSPFFRQAAMSIMSFIIYGLIRKYGDELAQSAYSISGSIVGFTLMPIFAMNQALQPITGFNYGAGEYERVKSSLLYGSYYASIYLVAVWIITTFFTWIPVGLMASPGPLADMAEECLYYVCLFYPLYGIVIISGNYFTSIGKATTAFVVTISREFLMLLPLLFLIAPIKGLTGIWFVLGAVDIPCFIVTLIVVIVDMKRINRLMRRETTNRFCSRVS